MNRNRVDDKSLFRVIEEHFWNLVGGSLVVGMVSGVCYVLIGIIFSEFYGNDTFWNFKYFYRYFFGLMVVYLLLPTVFANVLGFVIGSSSRIRARNSSVRR